MPIAFDRSLCCDFNETISREWLITNGLGGYAAGTVSGVLTRLQHGLLVASLRDIATPQLLLAKIDEEIVFDQRSYELGTNEYRDGMLSPAGFVHLEAFRLEEGFPVFTYHLGGIDGIVLEKRIWMPHGYNTTYIQYRVLRRTDASNVHSGTTNRGFGRYYDYPEAAQQALSLTLLPFSAYRPFHQLQHGKNDWHFQVQVHSNGQQHSFQEGNRQEQSEPLTLPNGVTGCTIRATDEAVPYSLFVVGHPDSQATFIPTGVWYWHFLRRHEQAAGRPAIDDLYLPGVIRAKLWADEGATLTIIATTEELSSLNFSLNQINTSYNRSVESQHNLLLPQRYFGEGGETSHYLHTLPLSSAPDPHTSGEEYLRFLLQAADRFLIERPVSSSEYATNSFFRSAEKTPSVLSEFYGLTESTRDTLIALPGLTLATGRHDEAYRILRHIARYFKQGLLPDYLPVSGSTAGENDYNSVDTTLWFFYALDHYLQTTRDYELLDELYQKLVDCIDWYIRGTFNGIQVDGNDGLLRAQQAGKALTWMNAHVNHTPVTPRQGKPVDVNALWYHALALMHEWSQRQLQVGHTNYTSSYYQDMLQRCQKSFQQRFWNGSSGYLYDVIDGPDGDDAALRPNQLLALSLRYAVLEQEHRQQVFTMVTQKLLTPYGLRTLSPDDAKYQRQLKEQHDEQQKALHQGSSWPWLMGPYIDALLNLSDFSASVVPSNSQREDKYQKNYGQIFWWQQSLSTLDPFRKLFSEGVLGMIGGVYDGELPQQSIYQVASVVSVGELLRVYNELANVVASSLAITKTNLVTMPQWS